MTYHIPTRDEAIKIAQDLVEGKRTPKDVAQWAAILELPENEKYSDALEKNDPLLREFLGTLTMAAAQPGENEGLLYGKEDFQEWLDDFLKEIS